MNELLNEIIEKAKRFLTNRDLLVFIFFLFISASLWTLQALRKNYVATVEIPISYTNLPKDYIITNELPEHLRLTLSGKGSDLVRYRYGSSLEDLEINMEEVAKGKRNVSTSIYLSQIQKKVSNETQVKRIYPDSLHFVLEKQKTKIVPVRLDATIDIHQQYTICDTVSINPKKITVYGPQKALNEIDTIYTEHIDLDDIKDTLNTTVELKAIKNIRFSDSTIQVKVCTEKFTETTIQVPITPKNVPNNCVLRIFPSSIALNYQVGLSNYEKIDASAFALEVDYHEAKKNGKDKLKIKIKRSPKKAFNIKLKSESVDYIIEEKNVNP